MRGVAGLFERSWSGEPGTLAWTKALHTMSIAYAVFSGAARNRARATRRAVSGCHVMAIGNLTVGGTGKSTIARWLALEAVKAGGRAAILLRGHRAEGAPGVVPDFEQYPLATRVARYGDEAVALRLALPREVAVAVDPDRRRAARAVRDGYGARVVILDDGWEQTRLAWDELWVALDPRRPCGNGSLLPAGPLRRPERTLRAASRVVFLLEEPGETVPEATRAWLERVSPGMPALRLQRTLCGASALRDASRRLEELAPGSRVAVLSGIGAPARLDRFLRGAGLDVRAHTPFPDHARWHASDLEAAVSRGGEAGAQMILITEKDEPRWPADLDPPLPVRVIRTGVRPLDSVEEPLRPLREVSTS